MRAKHLLPVAGVTAAALAATALAITSTGPSSSQSPYLVGSQPGVSTTSILSVGDAVDGYRMVGIPDGLGAFDNRDGTFTVLMNHELRDDRGAVRDHGAKGAFVSKWVVRKDDLSVVSGDDLVKQVMTWNVASGAYEVATGAARAFARLCSADLAPVSAFYDAESGKGYDGRLLTNGEETLNATAPEKGRAFAHALDGTSYELPYLGKAAWENIVPHPATGGATVTVGTDDGNGGQVYVYVGQKRADGLPVEKAGLVGGDLYGVSVDGVVLEPAADGIPSGSRFSLAKLGDDGDVSSMTGASLEAASDAANVTEFLRPEDAAWDPSNPGDLYFVTTASFSGKSRLWRLRFDDIADPAAGGTIDMLLDGTETGGTSERLHMMDNITVHRGRVLLQEDPGGNAYLARIWAYDIKTGRLTEVAQHDPARFTVGEPGFLTVDEESSGIIPLEGILGKSWYLADVQVHKPNPDPELVEYGQLVAIHIPQGAFPPRR